MVYAELQKAKDLVKELYGTNPIGFKEIAGIYHKNIDFVTVLSRDTKLRKFYLAIDRMYHKKNIEFELLNNNTQKADTDTQKQQNTDTNIFLQQSENIDFKEEQQVNLENIDNNFVLQQIEKANYGAQTQENVDTNLLLQQASQQVASKAIEPKNISQNTLF